MHIKAVDNVSSGRLLSTNWLVLVSSSGFKKTQMLKEVEIFVACAQFTSPSVSFVHRYRISSNVLHPQILFALKLYPQDRQG